MSLSRTRALCTNMKCVTLLYPSFIPPLISLLYSSFSHAALQDARHKKSIMQETTKKCIGILVELSSWCLQDLGTRMNRQKIETMVTIHVHQRDVWGEIATLYKQKKMNANPLTDFEWLKQSRFYYRPDETDQVDDDGKMVISVTDVDFGYQYEYLGVKDRLVITPLTDRCYITLSQALGMFFGGAPAGTLRGHNPSLIYPLYPRYSLALLTYTIWVHLCTHPLYTLHIHPTTTPYKYT